MTLHVTDTEFKLLRNYIEEQCGILLGDDKAYLVENRLAALVKENGCKSFGELYLRLRNGGSPRQLSELVVDAITTNETSWLRDRHPFVMLEKVLLPKFHEEILAGKRQGIRIWSAGCSTGQEPYSIAMTALDFDRAIEKEMRCRDNVRILATDISDTCLATAKAGKYDRNSVGRGLSQEYLERYFQQDRGGWVVDRKVKEMVTFKRFNLQSPVAGLGRFDIVFLRNVIIYFSDAFKRDLLNRMARLLSPAGYMFLGSGETVSGYTTSFDVLEFNGSLFYRSTIGKNSFGGRHEQTKNASS